jgi:ABC-type polysaccharide/polyol phosphate transport system ATPase subunit
MADVIRFEDVVKKYRLGVERSNMRAAIPWAKPAPFDPKQMVMALDEVNLVVNEGEAVGIIGDNGTGKSTLLKLIAGVVAPTSGQVKTRGRIASIIELGVGFHNDLTGMENLEFTAALMGMPPAEMRRRRDDIIDFAGIGYAMDTPVKRYSSGMLARLGFSVATHVDADIILVDEVLAVGDVDFQRLSLERLENLIYDGVTTVLVSHNLAAVGHLCSRVTRLEQGKLIADDDPASVILEYGGRMAIANAGLGRVPIRLKSLRIRPQEVGPSEPFEIEADIEVERALPRGWLRLVLRPTAELVRMHSQQEGSLDEIDLVKLLEVPVPADMLTKVGTWRIRGFVDKFPMFAGAYSFSLELLEKPHDDVLDVATAIIRVPGVTNKPEPITLPVTWSVDTQEPV